MKWNRSHISHSFGEKSNISTTNQQQSKKPILIWYQQPFCILRNRLWYRKLALAEELRGKPRRRSSEREKLRIELYQQYFFEVGMRWWLKRQSNQTFNFILLLKQRQRRTQKKQYPIIICNIELDERLKLERLGKILDNVCRKTSLTITVIYVSIDKISIVPGRRQCDARKCRVDVWWRFTSYILQTRQRIKSIVGWVMWWQMPILPQITMKNVCSAQQQQNTSTLRIFVCFIFISSSVFFSSVSDDCGMIFVLCSSFDRFSSCCESKANNLPINVDVLCCEQPKTIALVVHRQRLFYSILFCRLTRYSYIWMHRWPITYVLTKTYGKTRHITKKKKKSNWR